MTGCVQSRCRRVRSVRKQPNNRINDSIAWGVYKYHLAGLGSHSWSFLLRIHPSEPSQSSLTHFAWLIHHLVRLESIQLHCFEWLHLEKLGDYVLLRDSLVTLGDCRHLDGLVQWGSLSGGRCLSSAPIVVIVRGSWAFLWEITKGIFSGLLVAYGSPSCVGYVALGCRLGMWCLLAHEPPSGWIATTGT
jgi:hypothetical protein